MLKKTVKNYQGPVVLRNLSMWFFGAVLEYRGKRNSNIGKKGVLNLVHGQDWVRIADVVMAFLLLNRRKSKIGLRPGKSSYVRSFVFPSTQYKWMHAGMSMQCTTCFECYNTKFSMPCAMSLQYFWTPLTGFLHWSVIVKTQLRGFRNNTDRQLALKCPEDKMVGHLVLRCM